MIAGYKHFLAADQYEFGCPSDEWKGRLEHKAWGKRGNLILYFTDEDTGQKWWLSVFWTNAYSSKDGRTQFTQAAEIGDLFLLKTPKSRSDRPYIQSATKISSESSSTQTLIDEFLCVKNEFIYDGGNVSKADFVAAIDFLIAIEPEPSRFHEVCVSLGIDPDKEYAKLCEAHSASIANAKAAIRQYGRQIKPTTKKAMQDVYYEVLNAQKYENGPVQASMRYSVVNRLWDGINGWQA
jgi:hypothetical protein